MVRHWGWIDPHNMWWLTPRKWHLKELQDCVSVPWQTWTLQLDQSDTRRNITWAMHLVLILWDLCIFVWSCTRSQSLVLLVTPSFEQQNLLMWSCEVLQEGTRNYNRKFSPFPSWGKFTQCVGARCVLLSNHRHPRKMIIVDYFIGVFS